MEQSRFAFLLLILMAAPLYAGPGVSGTAFNPFTGKMDMLGPGSGLKTTENYQLYNQGGTAVYFTFDGTNFCLLVNGVSQVCYSQSPTSRILLLENLFILALEDGTHLTLE